MKKILSLLIVLSLVFTLSACGKGKTDSSNIDSTEETLSQVSISTPSKTQPNVHKHKFSAATCTEPEKCTCGETNGKALGHKWIDATCKAPKTCKVCKATKGKVAKHSYSKGVCTVCDKKDPDYKSASTISNKDIKKIVDESEGYILADMLEEFFRDDTYYYSFPAIKSSLVIVYYNNGTKETVKEALKKGKIKISDLDKWNIKYYKEPISSDPNLSQPQQ